MPSITANLAAVETAIAQACSRAQRARASVGLIAVSKTKPAAAIREAFAAGQRDFGENYLQEALAKQQQLADLPLVWHFIGPIQSNKTQALARCFSWVHSVERLKIAERLAAQRPAELAPLNLCLQVNIDQSPGKAGCAASEAPALALAIAALPRVRLRGLMAVPAPHSGEAPHRALAELGAAIARDYGIALDTLSMGMTDDMTDAIAAGATFVRIGTAIFGARS